MDRCLSIAPFQTQSINFFACDNPFFKQLHRPTDCYRYVILIHSILAVQCMDCNQSFRISNIQATAETPNCIGRKSLNGYFAIRITIHLIDMAAIGWARKTSQSSFFILRLKNWIIHLRYPLMRPICILPIAYRDHASFICTQRSIEVRSTLMHDLGLWRKSNFLPGALNCIEEPVRICNMNTAIGNCRKSFQIFRS